MSEKTHKLELHSDLKVAQKKKIRDWFLRILLFLLAAVLTTLILSFELRERVGGDEFLIGEPAPRSLFSPLEFSYENKEATQSRQEQAADAVAPVFIFNRDVPKKINQNLNEFFKTISDYRKRVEAQKQSAAEAPPAPEAPKLPFELQPSSVRYALEEMNLEDSLKQLANALEQNLSRGILSPMDKQDFLKRGISVITLTEEGGKERSSAALKELPDLLEVKGSFEKMLPQEILKNKNAKNALIEIFNGLIQPNLESDEPETKSRRKRAAELVPAVEEKVKKNELIVQRGMRILLQDKLRIDQIQKKLAEHKALNQLFSTGLLVVMSYLLCLVYLIFLGKEIFETFRATTLFLSIMVLTVFISKLIAVWPGSSYYLMPTSLAPLLFVLLLRPRFGFLSAVLMAVFAALLSDFNSEVILATLFSGFGATFAGIKVRKRIEFLRIGLIIGAVHFLVLFAARIFHEYPADESFQISVLGFANGFLISTPICFIVLSLFEWVFNLATDITLLELSDLNHPLLKRMIVEAPGTYHHSLVVSTLAEAACEAIGANALLARVGCYFHDIGKIARAEFFTENMKNQHQSKHLKLTPTMSCLIIMNHVKEGVDLGRKYKLKQRILQFIPEHQGTGVIYYFYRKALDHAHPNDKVNPDDFRYPGPKPQSRETAVALLADSTEAASRSLKDPSPESISQLVRKIINDKFIDGQLDECDLTLRDLHKIQESFVRNLMAIFHTRVVYPAVEDGGNRPDLFAEGEFSKYRVEDFKKPH